MSPTRQKSVKGCCVEFQENSRGMSDFGAGDRSKIASGSFAKFLQHNTFYLAYPDEITGCVRM